MHDLTAAHPSPARPLRAFGRIIEALAVLAGLPAFLIAAAGWPLPHEIPTRAEVQRAYQIRNVPDRLITGSLACAAWTIWALLLIALIHGLIAQVRLSPQRRPRFVPASVHRLAGRWIGAGALVAVLATRPAVAHVVPVREAITVTTRTAEQLPATSKPEGRPTIQPRSTTTAPGRTYIAGANETYWDIAEAALGDGTRWREILDANPQLGQIDLVPEGTTLTIPVGRDVTVERGDNLWNLAKDELTDAHQERPTNAEIVPYWLDVIDTNTPHLRSGDPDLIYPGETINLPPIPDDQRDQTPPSADQPPATTDPEPSATIPAAPAPTAPAITPPPTTAAPEPTASDVEPDADSEDYEPFTIPWLDGLAITGVSAAVILAAWHAQRRRRIRAHRSGDPLPTLTDNDRDLITQLRGIATDQRLAAIDTTMRLLAASTRDGSSAPAITIARAGRHAVELLLDNRTEPTPPNFLRLDQHTIVVNPGLPDEALDQSTAGVVHPSPGLVVIGTDDVGDVLVDLERISALTIETADDTTAPTVLTALITQLACQPWAASVQIHTLGAPTTIDPERRITAHTSHVTLLDAAEAHLQSQTDATIERGTHAARIATNEAVGLLVAVLSPGHSETASALAVAARQSGSALVLVTCDPIPETAWRLVITGQRATLEPAGITVTNNTFFVSTIDEEASGQLIDTLGEPTAPPDAGVAAPISPPQLNSADEETATEPTDDGTPFETSGDDTPTLFAQPPLLGHEPCLTGLSVSEQIEAIMRPRPIELVLLDGQPRLDGVIWDRKKAPRADEITAFLMLNGPSTLRQVALALWPDHPHPDNTASQTISKTRALLGQDEYGRPRLGVGNRAKPYEIRDVGCDWTRFEQLVDLARHRPDDEAGLLRAALTLVRRAPFETTRVRSFDWATDHCFDSRMRIRIATAADRLRELTDGAEREWASSFRGIVTA